MSDTRSTQSHTEAQITEQAQLFAESFGDAVLALAFQTGGKKALAAYLWPDRAEDDPARASRWLDDCFNPKKRSVFSWSDTVRAMRYGREHGCDVLTNFICGSAGYEPPRVAHIKSAKVRMAEKASKAWAEAARLQAEAEAMPDD